MRIKLLLAALCGVALLIGSTAAQRNTRPADIAASATPAAPDTDRHTDAGRPAGEVEDLKRRVEELEEQNRALARTLAEINSKLGAPPGAPPTSRRRAAANSRSSGPRG